MFLHISMRIGQVIRLQNDINFSKTPCIIQANKINNMASKWFWFKFNWKLVVHDKSPFIKDDLLTVISGNWKNFDG